MFYYGEIIWEGVARLSVHCALIVVMKLGEISIQVIEGLFIVYVFLSLVFDFWFENVVGDIDGEVYVNDTTEINYEETDFIEETSLNDQQTVNTSEDRLNVRETFISSAEEETDVIPSTTSEQDSNDESESVQVRQCPDLSVIPRVDKTEQTIRHSVNIKDEMVTFSQQSKLVNIVKRRRQGMQQQNQPSNQPLICLTETTTIISQHSGPKGSVIKRRNQIDQQSQLWSHALPNRCEESFMNKMKDEEGIDQQCDNATEMQTLLHSEEHENIQSVKQQDNEESRNLQNPIQDSKNRLSSRLQEYTEVHSKKHNNDLESIADHHETLTQEKEIVPLFGKPDTGVAMIEKEPNYTLKQESDDDNVNQQCDHSYEAHKYRKIGNSLAFKDQSSNFKDDSSQHLCHSQDTAFAPLIKEEMVVANDSESHDPQTLLQPCDEAMEDFLRQYSERCSHSRKEMEILMPEIKEETDNQNWIEPHDSKVNVEESCAWKERKVVHSQRYEEETKVDQEQPIQLYKREIEEPHIQSIGANVKDTRVLPNYLEIEKEDEDYYPEIVKEDEDYYLEIEKEDEGCIESHDTKVGFDKIPDENGTLNQSQIVENKHDDKEQQNRIFEQEIEELCIEGQSKLPDTEDKEGFTPSSKDGYHECIEPHDTDVTVEETCGKKKDTAVHSQPCEEETYDIGHKCKKRSQPLSQESKDTGNVIETANLEHQLTRSPRVEIVCHTKITMKKKT